MAQMLWGIGWRMNAPPVIARIAGLANVPFHETCVVAALRSQRHVALGPPARSYPNERRSAAGALAR